MVSTTSTIVHESYSKYSEYSEYSKYRPSTHLQECCCSKKGGMPRSADWLSGEGGGESRVASQLEKISAGGGIHPTDESAAATPSGCMGGGVGGTAGVKLWGSASVQGCCPLRWFRSQSLLRLRSPASASWQARLSSRSSAHIDSSLCAAVAPPFSTRVAAVAVTVGPTSGTTAASDGTAGYHRRHVPKSSGHCGGSTSGCDGVHARSVAKSKQKGSARSFRSISSFCAGFLSLIFFCSFFPRPIAAIPDGRASRTALRHRICSSVLR